MLILQELQYLPLNERSVVTHMRHQDGITLTFQADVRLNGSDLLTLAVHKESKQAFNRVFGQQCNSKGAGDGVRALIANHSQTLSDGAYHIAIVARKTHHARFLKANNIGRQVMDPANCPS